MPKLIDQHLVKPVADRLAELPDYKDVVGKLSPKEFIQLHAPAIRELRSKKNWPVDALARELKSGGMGIGLDAIAELIKSVAPTRRKRRKASTRTKATPQQIESPPVTPTRVEPERPSVVTPAVVAPKATAAKTNGQSTTSKPSTTSGSGQLREDF
jgi:hypothetical protein